MRNVFKSLPLIALGTFIMLSASCSSDDYSITEDPSIGLIEPIELDCNFFMEDQILSKIEGAPVDYIVCCKASVEGRLTIEPGSLVIAFTKDPGLDFKVTTSSIHAVGTYEEPIIMTGTESNIGWSRGLFFRSGDESSLMEYVTVSYGGGEQFSGQGFANIQVYADGALTMKNCTVSHSGEIGLKAIKTIRKLTLENNTFTENAYPLLLDGAMAHMASPTHDYTSNDLDRVMLHLYTQQIHKPVVWKNINVPFRTISGNVSIQENGILEIEPGVEIEMAAGSMFKVNTKGGLKIVGTEVLPIKIRGDLSGPGSWKGIDMKGTHPINEIGFAKISDAGENPSSNMGAISLWYDTKLNIHDTEFKDLASCGVYGKLFSEQPSNPNYSSSNLTFTNTECNKLFEE